jgi:serine/threonine protein kinase
MEFLNGGSLGYHLNEEKRFNEERTRIYSAEILVGIQFLHSELIIHRYISNIIIYMYIFWYRQGALWYKNQNNKFIMNLFN